MPCPTRCSSSLPRGPGAMTGRNGTQKSWDFMKTHDSVTILMFNSSRRSLVLVKQFRPAVYAGEVERLFPGSLAAADQDGPRELQPALPGSAGVTYELCAGLVDQPGLSLEQVACKEAWEECGYHLAPSGLRRVATYNPGQDVGVQPSLGLRMSQWVPDLGEVRGQKESLTVSPDAEPLAAFPRGGAALLGPARGRSVLGLGPLGDTQDLVQAPPAWELRPGISTPKSQTSWCEGLSYLRASSAWLASGHVASEPLGWRSGGSGGSKGPDLG
ncbi:uridine diphosphate glucose pyrophosphatase NUDT14 isoform X2 [Sagmatias obliquidens]|uniref:uridine diphosphate glucose pyrophosphatase NUDT14 isoform X2 n=1 Tax=Sagmatias obliquidens TaxID=3371155 RepID=UPI000F443B22|nr:uridine diphosphate glucose pyrophosphatase isoform X2 [Lagenorhynchus obliquidens]